MPNSAPGGTEDSNMGAQKTLAGVSSGSLYQLN